MKSLVLIRKKKRYGLRIHHSWYEDNKLWEKAPNLGIIYGSSQLFRDFYKTDRRNIFTFLGTFNSKKILT